MDTSSRTKKKSKTNPKERWKRAYKKVLKEVQKAKLPMDDRAKIMEEWKQHKAHETIFRVYEELIERRRMLELLRLSINIGPSANINMGKNPFLMSGNFIILFVYCPINVIIIFLCFLRYFYML